MPVAGSIVANVVARTGSFERGMKRVNKSMAGLGKQANIMAGRFIKWGAAAAAAITAMALKMASDIEDVEMRIIAITGSTKEAKRIMQEMGELGPITPFETQELRVAAATLVTFGIEAEAVGETMETLADIAAISSIGIEELAMVFGKVRGEGIAFQERLNQLSARQIPIIDKLREKLGMVGEDGSRAFRKFVEDGKVSFALFAEVMRDMTMEGQAFFEGSEKAANTLTGSISTLMSNIYALGEEMGEHLRPIAIKIVKKLNEWVIVNKDMIMQTIKQIAKFAAWAMTIAITIKVLNLFLRVGSSLLILYKNLRTAQITFLALAGPGGWKTLLKAGVIAVGAWAAIEYGVRKATVAMGDHKDAIEETRNALAEVNPDDYKTPEQIAREQEKIERAAKKLADEQKRIHDAHLRDLKRFVIAVEKPFEKYKRLIDVLNQMWNKGGMALETYRRTVMKYRKDLKDTLKDQRQFNRELANLYLAPSHDPRTVSGFGAFLQGSADMHARKRQASIANQQLQQLQQINRNTANPITINTGTI